MRRRFVVVSAATGALLLAAGAVLVLTGTPGTLAAGSESGATAPQATSSASPAGSAGPSNTPPGTSTEARVPEPTTSDGSAPESTSPPALVTLPLPETDSAVGSVVAGFPDRIPVAPQSTVASSSVSSDGARLQATLAANTSLTVSDVLAFYTAAWAEVGLTGAPVPASDGSSAVAFSRGPNSITLTVTPTEAGCEYAVFGTLSAET